MASRAWHMVWNTGCDDGGRVWDTGSGIQGMGYRDFRVRAWGTEHILGQNETASTPSPKSCEEQPQRTRPGLSALSLSDKLCPWHLPHEAADPLPHSGQGDAPQPSLTLPGAQRGLSGSESLLLLLLPPLSDSGLLWDGEPTSEGGGVSISITSAFTTSMGASALVPRLQWVPRSFAGSAGSRVS